jgi:hypothetical protein
VFDTDSLGRVIALVEREIAVLGERVAEHAAAG